MPEPQAPILIVEDDDELRHILAVQLHAKGWVAEEARSAEEATARLHDGVRPGLSLVDINLPGDTGWDLLRSLAFDAAGSPPVVITSAVTVHPRQIAEFSCAGYLPKPANGSAAASMTDHPTMPIRPT